MVFLITLVVGLMLYGSVSRSMRDSTPDEFYWPTPKRLSEQNARRVEIFCAEMALKKPPVKPLSIWLGA